MDDAELKAMEAALKALSGLQPEEQKRVLIWLSEKLNLPPILFTSRQALVKKGFHPIVYCRFIPTAQFTRPTAKKTLPLLSPLGVRRA